MCRLDLQLGQELTQLLNITSGVAESLELHHSNCSLNLNPSGLCDSGHKVEIQ